MKPPCLSGPSSNECPLSQRRRLNAIQIKISFSSHCECCKVPLFQPGPKYNRIRRHRDDIRFISINCMPRLNIQNHIKSYYIPIAQTHDVSRWMCFWDGRSFPLSSNNAKRWLFNKIIWCVFVWPITSRAPQPSSICQVFFIHNWL